MVRQKNPLSTNAKWKLLILATALTPILLVLLFPVFGPSIFTLTLAAPVLGTLFFGIKVGLLTVAVTYLIGMTLLSQLAPLGAMAGILRSLVPLSGNILVVFGANKLRLYLLARTAAEKALKESEEKYRVIFEKSADGILSFDQAGTITDASFHIQTHLGIDPMHLIGKRIAEASALPTSLTEKIEMLIVEASPVSNLQIEAETATADGGKKFFEVIFSYLGKQHGATCAVCLIRDTTQRRNMLSKAHHNQKMEAVGRLAGGVAHDMNNTFNVIMSSVFAFRKDAKARLLPSEDLDRVLEACNRGAELTRNLLGFARKGNYKQEIFSLNNTVLRLKELLLRTASKNIRFETDMDKTLPGIQGDESQIESAIMNVCLNGVDAMADGGVLSIRTRNENGEILLSVSDTGMGMDEKTISQVFEPFFTTKPLGRGTGLGLSLTWGVLHSHNGTVRIHSEVGKGTTVTLSFPAVQGETPIKEKSISINPPDWAALPSRPKILLVDDEPLVLRSGKRLLETLGCSVVIAEGGKKAVEIYRQGDEQFSLVILDLLMPDMDGAATLAKLLEIDCDVRVLLSSGYSRDAGSIERLLEDGALGFLAKPYHPDELSRAVRKVLFLSDMNRH